jgi:hypothetical protein
MDSYYTEDLLLGTAPADICLFGDRANRGGRQRFLRYSWLEEQRIKYGDDQWFDACLIENFVLNDLSNVYFGIYVENQSSAFDIWINTLQLNFNAID